jgi:hypothetical protein
MWKGRIIAIPKDKTHHPAPGSYRPITLANIFLKILDKYFAQNISKTLEETKHFTDEQAGFRPSRSCQEHALTLELLKDIAKKEGSALHCWFVDLKKAFDSIDRHILFNELQSTAICPQSLHLMQEIYNKEESTIQVGNITSRPFQIRKGVRQGAPSSPTLFNVIP